MKRAAAAEASATRASWKRVPVSHDVLKRIAIKHSVEGLDGFGENCAEIASRRYAARVVDPETLGRVRRAFSNANNVS